MKKISAFLTFTIFCLLTFKVEAGDTSGSCGDHCSWTINGDTLKLTGYGDINGYEVYQSPWYPNRNQIKKIVIENESDTNTFKSIGGGSFIAMTKVKEVVLPEGLEKIERYAFHYASSLEKINFPSSLKQIDFGAFNQTAIKDFVLPENVVLSPVSLGSDKLESVIVSGSTDLTEAMLLATVDGNWDNLQIPATLQTIYCDATNESCQNLLNSNIGNKVKPYTEEGNRYVVDGQKYRTLSDMQQQKPVKRIYTVKEANEASGKKNTVMIRYK